MELHLFWRNSFNESMAWRCIGSKISNSDSQMEDGEKLDSGERGAGETANTCLEVIFESAALASCRACSCLEAAASLC